MMALELLILAYFLYVAGYTAIFSVAAYFYRAPETCTPLSYKKFCILIPAYKEDSVILDTVRNSLKQFYPRDSYDVVVIADKLLPVTIFELNNLPVRVIKVSFDQSTKVKSLNEAFAQLPDSYDYGVILDADNVMTRHFLRNMNNLIQLTKMRAIQGQRIPKNQGNKLSFLDGVSEAINNHIYRQGASALDLSASINGSGIVIDYALLKSKLSTMNAVGGFDRELELLLLKEGVKVYYYKEAIILDEKVSEIGAFQNQRRRWIASQYFYLRKYFREGMTALFHGQTAFFNSAVLRNIQLPRLINICLLFVLAAASFFVKDYLYFGYFWWPLLFVINAVAIFSAIPKEYYSIKFVRSIGELPALFFRMSLLLFKMKGANRRFLHTPHGIKPHGS